MKKVMILGGGYYQLPLIQTSVRLGYYTIVCGIKGDYPGYAYADKWIDVDTFDKDACLEVARREQIDGILVCGTDAVMPTIGHVVDNMGLIGPSYASTIAASDKAVMKEAFVRHGVRTAAYEKVRSFDEASAFAALHGFPVVLKVVDASGSRGVEIIHSMAELMSVYDEVHALTKKDYLVVEEFVSGLEFGAQSFVRNGRLTFVMPHGDMVFHAKTDVPIGHYAPFEQANELLPDITEQLQKCVKALGIDNTAINADFILKDGKVYVLEIGARAGATCLPELVSNYYGLDYYEYLLRNCVGDESSFSYTHVTPSLVETLLSTRTGKVKSIHVGTLPPEVVSLEIYPKVGDEVRSFQNAFDRIGTLVMKGISMEKLYISRQALKDKSIIIELQ